VGHTTGGDDAWARLHAYLVDPMKRPQVLLGSALAAFWSLIEPSLDPPPKSSPAPSDNLQTPMNLVMPLNFSYVAYRAELGHMLFDAADEILAGLNNVGTVHFARFDVIGGNLCMFSIFDGDFEGYIRDFIGAIGGAFDGIMKFVKDPAPTPCGQNVDQFVAWVRGHDSLQMPELASDVTPGLRALQRQTLVQLYRHPNAQMGVYRGYPGYSVAQIRDGLEIGW